jgi:hypothetical protein
VILVRHRMAALNLVSFLAEYSYYLCLRRRYGSVVNAAALTTGNLK